MKVTSRNLLVIVVLGFVIPQITLAAWWNPVSWFKKAKSPKVEVVDKKVATSTAVVVASSTTPTAITESKKQKEILTSPKKQLPPVQINPVETPKQEVPKQEAQKTETKNRIISLPSGAVVELDARGDVVRTIKEVPAKTTNDIVSDLTSQIDILKKQNEAAERQRAAQQQLLEEQQKTLEQIKQNTTPPPPPAPVVREPSKLTSINMYIRGVLFEDGRINNFETQIPGGGCEPLTIEVLAFDQRKDILIGIPFTLTTSEGTLTKNTGDGRHGNQPVARFYYNPSETQTTNTVTISGGGFSVTGTVGVASGYKNLPPDYFEQKERNGQLLWIEKNSGQAIDINTGKCLVMLPGSPVRWGPNPQPVLY